MDDKTSSNIDDRSGPQFVSLACARNFRDFGGIRIANGSTVRAGMLFRSDFVRMPDDQEEAILEGLEISTIFDLRSAKEAGDRPNDFWSARGLDVRHHPVGSDVRAGGSIFERLRDDSSLEGVTSLLEAIYRQLPRILADALRDIFDYLADEPSPMLIHCSAGKDRTGFSAAMILQLLGVSREAIFADFLDTNKRVGDAEMKHARGLFDEMLGYRMEDESLSALVQVDQRQLEMSYSYLERKYGGADAYLTDFLGVSKSQRDAIRANLLTPR